MPIWPHFASGPPAWRSIRSISRVEKLPAFDGDKVAAKMNAIAGQSRNAEQKTAWDQIVEIANRFIAADRYLFAVPMWNGGIPYRLKHYIDIIHQPGLLWGLKPDTGYFGLLRGKHRPIGPNVGRLGSRLPVAGVRRRPSIDLPARTG